MSKATENLQAAQQRAMAVRPTVGGFPYLAETLRRAGVTRNLWFLPACQSLYHQGFRLPPRRLRNRRLSSQGSLRSRSLSLSRSFFHSWKVMLALRSFRLFSYSRSSVLVRRFLRYRSSHAPSEATATSVRTAVQVMLFVLPQRWVDGDTKPRG